jgi:hypothetical protein
MKRLILTVLALILAVSIADARRKREMAGTVKDGFYQDDAYELKIPINDNWKANVGTEGASTRVILVQKKFAVPQRYADAADYTYIPKVVVWVDTSSLSPQVFLDSLVSDTWKSKQKKSIDADFDILSQKDLTPKGRRLRTLAKETSSEWEGEAKYVKDVASSSSDNSGVRVSGKYYGLIIAVKHSGTMYLFQLMCESDYGESILKEVRSMVDSLAFVKAAD